MDICDACEAIALIEDEGPEHTCNREETDLMEVIRKVRDYLDLHNGRIALEGYLNDIAEELNPILAKLDIAPIEIVEGDDD